MKIIIPWISALTLFFGTVSVQATDYNLAIVIPFNEGVEECSTSESARIHGHVRKAMRDSGYASKGNSRGWQIYNDGELQDTDTILEILSNRPNRRAPECSENWCWFMCQTQGTYCGCCGSCDCGQRRMLRVLQGRERELPDAVAEIRTRIRVDAYNDKNIECVDIEKTEVIVEPVE